jgi:hypothetical protein
MEANKMKTIKCKLIIGDGRGAISGEYNVKLSLNDKDFKSVSTDIYCEDLPVELYLTDSEKLKLEKLFPDMLG